MAGAEPHDELDDRSLVARCASGEPGAFEALLARHARLVRSIVVRAVDERRPGALDEVDVCFDTVVGRIERERTLVAWDGRSTLRHYLAVVVRQRAIDYLQDVTPPGTLVSSLPPPAPLFLDEVLAEEPARRVAEVIERQPPNVGGLVRLRLRGMSASDIGSTLGMGTDAVRAHLDRLASRLGELAPEGVGAAAAAWRMTLDAATPEERVATASRTLVDDAFRRSRSVVESTFRAVRERELERLHPRTPECLDEISTAAFVDGSLRGPERARAEGHVATCARCIDAVARLATDLRTLDALRDASEHAEDVAVAAACIATGRHRAGGQLAQRAAQAEDPRAIALLRLSRVGATLAGGAPPAPPAEPSRVVSTRLPTDEEAPVVAMEALAGDDPRTAARAIDDELARGSLGLRLRLIALGAGDDPAAARVIAEELHRAGHSDPSLVVDARSILAAPGGDALPREIVVERLRDAVPAVVRHVLSR